MTSSPLFISFAKAITKRARPPLRMVRRPFWNATAETTPNKPAISTETAPRLRKGDKVDVKITHLAYGGASVGHIFHPRLHPSDESIPVYAPKGACPGDTVRCSVSKIRRRRPDPAISDQFRAGSKVPDSVYAEAMFVEPLSISQDAVHVPCKHFGHFRLAGGGCGGCTTMHLSYAMQLEQKQRQMQSLYDSLSKANGVIVSEIIPCERLFQFRNKMEFSFGRRWIEKPIPRSEVTSQDSETRQYTLGLHAPQRFDKIIQIDQCHIQPHIGNEILSYIRRRSTELLLEPYDTMLDTGYLRNVAIRSATNRAGKLELMVNIITGPCNVPGRLVPLAQELLEEFPDITCVVQNIRGIKSSVAIDEGQERLLAGSRNYIEQTLCGLHFRISANSFFQTNPSQAEILYEAVRTAARLTKNDAVLDLFCGTGTIGLCLATYAKHVHGVDIVPTAIEDARTNAASNNIRNTTFVEGNLDKLKKEGSLSGHDDVDVIVVDPPRAGLHMDLVKFIARSKAKRIVYVSCNPATQVRDIHLLRNLAPTLFRVTRIQPVDMFPHTHHVECVTTLERNVV